MSKAAGIIQSLRGGNTKFPLAILLHYPLSSIGPLLTSMPKNIIE
jgi:hypothetical protein